MNVRQGAPKAVMALTHHMLAVIYRMLGHREEYVELGGNHYDQQRKPNVVARSVTRLIRLGHQVDLRPSIS